MQTLHIMESSLGAYSTALQKAFEDGFKVSENPKHYPWLDLQFNAILEKGVAEKQEKVAQSRGRPAKS